MPGPALDGPVKVFVSYRRSDVAGHAGRLYDALSQRLGVDRVFMDIDTIPVGVDFADVVREALDRCDILLALIGKGWSDARDRSGRRRLDLPDDYVRLELETAFERRIPILPILLQDAEMPSEGDLPPSLSRLARVNALELSDRRWRRDIEMLYETLRIPAGDIAESDGDRESPAPNAPARDVRKLVSVVLAELSASPSSAEPDPEVIDGARRRYFDAAGVAVERHGGTVQRFLDDSVVGLFGVPVAHEDDALRATRAASELLAILTDAQPGVATGVVPALDARIVVLTDETVIRSDPASSVAAGDLVGRAARLQRVADAGTILLSETTFRLVQSEVEAIELEGDGTGARAYRLQRVRRVDETVAQAVRVPLIGRDRELRILERLVEDCVADATCALVTLLGEAGIGKTRIVAALEAHLGDSARVVVGRCASYGEGITFLPVAQIIEALAGIERTDHPDGVRAKLDAVVERFALPPVAAVGLARLVGNEPPAGEIEESFWAFRSVLEGFARERPLVVVFEDLHWADESVFEVIEHVSDWSTGAPLLIVATARPDLLERRPEWAGGKRQTTTRTLQPLGSDAARDLLEALPHGAGLPGPVAGRLLEAAGGIPLFLEEVLSALVQRRTGDDSPDTIPTNVVMPQSLSALLEARIDQLTPAERTVLQCASVVGDSVDMAPLSALTELEAATLAELVLALVRRDILAIVAGDAREPKTVQCRHALLREAAYRSLTKHERATLHEAFVAWIDAEPNLTGEQREALVARQLELAITTSREIGRATADHMVERAITAFNAVIDDANGRGRATGELLARVEQLASRDATMRAGLGPRLASALADKGDCDAAAAILADWGTDDARSVQWQLADAALRTARLSSGDYEAATAILDRLASSEPSLEPADEIETLHHRGFLETQFGQRAAAVVDFTRAAAIARAESFTHYEIRALRHLVTSAAYGPTPVEDLERILGEVSERMEQLGSRPAAIARGVALLAAMRGETEPARSALQDYFDLEQTYGLSRHLASHGQDVYDIEWWAGDLDAARLALEASDKQLRLMGAENYRTTVLAQLSRVLARQGRLDEAIAAAAEAEHLVEPYDSDSLVLLHSAFANAYARSGRYDDAVEAGRHAVAVETDCLLDRGEAFLSYAEALARAGRVEEALTVVGQAIDCFERKGALAPLRAARATLEAFGASGVWPT